jgi:hypothetical protein
MNDRRGSWYLLTGLVIGLALGLVYAWVISPVAYVDTDPSTLREDFKDVYRSQIAAAYAATGNLPRARLRLALLKDADPATALAAQAQAILAQGGPQDDARHLALLAADLGKASAKNTPTAVTPSLTLSVTSTLTSTPIFSPTPESTPTVSTATPQPTQMASPTETTVVMVAPTRTPVPTLSAPFILKERQQVCDPSLPEALLQVQVTDAAGQPLPGVEIRVTWQGGEDFFFTGLKPELGVGYADFEMTEGNTYTAQLAAGSQIANDLTVPDCSQTGGANYWGGWLLVFSQ